MKTQIKKLVSIAARWDGRVKGSGAKKRLKIRYQFERLPPQRVSALETFGRNVERALHNMPGAIPDMPFGVSSRVCSGVFEALPEDSEDFSALRLGSIAVDDRVLLRNTWGQDGEIRMIVYPDGQAASYQYDANRRIQHAAFGDAYQISYQYDNQGLCSKASYGVSSRIVITCERSSKGMPMDIRFPQGGITFRRGAEGDLLSYETEAGNVEYDVSEQGKRPVAVLLSAGTKKLHFPTVSGSANVVREDSPEGGTSTMLSPMGIHVMNERGFVRTWVRWDGRVMKLIHRSDGLVRWIWSTKGATSFEYSKDGKLISAYRPDGYRYYWHSENGTSPAIVVSPGGAVLLKYDKTGRPASLIDSWGGHLSVKYGRLTASPFPKRAMSPLWGAVEIRYGRMNRIASVALTGKGRVSLDYGPKGELRSIQWSSPDNTTASQLLHLVGWLWTLMSAGRGAYLGGFEWSYWVS